MRSVKRRITLLCVAALLAGLFLAGYYFAHQQRAFAQRTACVGSLIRIRLAKLVYAEEHGLTNGAVIPDEVVWRENGIVERCGSGGRYSINAVGAYPSCSYNGVVRLSGRLWRHVWPE
jgi:hypothetical protein